MNIRIPEAAKLELNEATAYFGSIDQDLGDRFLDCYHEILFALLSRARSFGKLETYRGKKDIRRCLFMEFPYVLIFEIKSDTQIEIVAVAHASRQPNYWRKRLE